MNNVFDGCFRGLTVIGPYLMMNIQSYHVISIVISLYLTRPEGKTCTFSFVLIAGGSTFSIRFVSSFSFLIFRGDFRPLVVDGVVVETTPTDDESRRNWTTDSTLSK